MNDSLSIVDRSNVDPGFIISELLTRVGFGPKVQTMLGGNNPLLNEIIHYLNKSDSPTLGKGYNKDRASSEWKFEGSNFENQGLLQQVYDTLATDRWSNGDDLTFLQHIGSHDGQKIRVIFYNSIGYSDIGSKKLSFDDWMEQGKFAIVYVRLY